ncbi:MAG TPA: anti-sigma factor [Trueperaceae bacterium]|nr:anti-sigma factor [Trueperaceae bacterium]
MTVDRDTLSAYAFGALTPDEERRVAEHLNKHPEDAAYVRDVLEALAEVALSQTPAELPAGSEQALLDRIRAQPNETSGLEARQRELPSSRQGRGRSGAPARRYWWPTLAAAAVVVIALVTLLRQPDLDARIAARLNEACAEAGVVCETLLSDDQQPLGTVARLPDAQLLVVLDTPPPDGQVFQAWAIVDGVASSLGVYQGRVLEVDTPLVSGGAFGITIEPPGGSPQPTSTPIVVLPL